MQIKSSQMLSECWAYIRYRIHSDTSNLSLSLVECVRSLHHRCITHSPRLRAFSGRVSIRHSISFTGHLWDRIYHRRSHIEAHLAHTINVAYLHQVVCDFLTQNFEAYRAIVSTYQASRISFDRKRTSHVWSQTPSIKFESSATWNAI